jgi:hypothetical protein
MLLNAARARPALQRRHRLRPVLPGTRELLRAALALPCGGTNAPRRGF